MSLSHLALPLGISFWTFQALSYLFDLYRGEELDPTLPEFALYMAFFPVTISGPVCRMPNMSPQFRTEQTTSWDDIGEGLRRIAIGAFMTAIGETLGQGILAGDSIITGFDRATNWTGPDVWCSPTRLWIATVLRLRWIFPHCYWSRPSVGNQGT